MRRRGALREGSAGRGLLEERAANMGCGNGCVGRSQFCPQVVEALRARYGDLYTERNVMISGTHTHSGPGGFLQDILFDLSTLGFVKDTFEALVGGIALSIHRAHQSMQKGRVFVVTGELRDVSMNRSPTAYMNNPESERRKYKDNVDKTMVQMRFVTTDNQPLGAINWYAVHATSMNNTNTLVSSDNLGYAAIVMEKRMNGRAHPGKGAFVAAFASSNEGDVTPNTQTPRCQLSGRPCDVHTSACPTRRDQCVASGPGRDMFDSTRIIGTRLADKAWELWGSTSAVEMKGPVGFAHQFVDMPTQRATYYDEKTRSTKTSADHLPRAQVRGCLPAMGYSFAAGTTDGPGSFSFRQGTTSDNPLWNAIRDLLAEPTPDDIECHGAKPILLQTGSMTFPFEWQPRIVSTQLGQVGELVMACVPGEFTTMSGRRMRIAVRDALVALGAPDSTQVQRYEGASTIFGPHTLTLYLAQYRRLAEYMARGEHNDPGPQPPELMNDVLSLQTPVVYDSPKWGHKFGDVLLQPPEVVRAGDLVTATFVAGNPRNDVRHGMTYLTVERLENNRWVIEATDAYWETKFKWERTSTILGTSEATVLWEVGPNTPPGTYRIRHFGNYKYIFGGVFEYIGVTQNFTVSTSMWQRLRPRRTATVPVDASERSRNTPSRRPRIGPARTQEEAVPDSQPRPPTLRHRVRRTCLRLIFYKYSST
ncbi:Neutral ceramidase [Gryllus bimaculatus]|nr:Neutral ceramidase [Gryllus bimaculatus]